MDYIRISSQRSAVSGQCMVAEVNGQQTTDNRQQTLSTSVEEIKNLLKDWLKLYPNSFAPDVEFKIYQLADGDIIIELHEDLSSMAVSLLVLYFENISQQDNKTTRQQGLVAETVEAPIANSQQPIAYITIDDTEILLKQNEGKRAMIFCSCKDAETLSHKESVAEPVEAPTSVRFILEDNYVLDYNFEKRPRPVKDSNMTFEETEFSLPEEYESVRVGDVVKKKIDDILEDEGLTPKKMLMYILCAAIGLSIGFLIVYFMGK